MKLANISNCVYLQDDPGQHQISHILYKLHMNDGKEGAAIPVRATFTDYHKVLMKEYNEFNEATNITCPATFLQKTNDCKIFKPGKEKFLSKRSVKQIENRGLLESCYRFYESL